MAVYYKFKSAKDYDSVTFDGHFISVGNLKEKIFESKHLGKGTDFDLLITNAQTNEEYLDEGTLIPKNTSVLIRRVPGRPRMPIVTAPVTEHEESNVESNPEDVEAVKIGFAGPDPPATKYAEDFEWDEFGNDLYAIPETMSVQSSNPVHDAPPTSKEDEDMKIKALIDTPTLDWQRQSSDGFGPGRGFGRGMGGRMMGGRGFGRGILDRKTPPQGYICHRCKVPGHFIQHCPTNGDPNFDIKRVKPPTGIPKSMLMATPDGSYALPSGAVAVLKPNEAAFEKEIEGMPSTRSVGDLPPELHCPLCKEVMKDAVLTSKCCFKSFCYKCIRDHIISKSMCVCGATNILADDLLPNKTVRETINRILESNHSSGENGGSVFQGQDMESRYPKAMAPSPSQSAASKGQQASAMAPEKEETSKIAETLEDAKAVHDPRNEEKPRTPKPPEISEATRGSLNHKEETSTGGAQLAEEEVQEKPISGEAGKKKKKKKVRMPPNAAEMQWTGQDLGAENYMMPFGPSSFNPYWTGVQPGMDGFMPPYNAPMPYMGYGLNPMDIGFGCMMPQDPFGGPGFMMPYGGPPQRDLADLAMGFNARPPLGPPVMSREEFEARKADLKRKREMERQVDRESSKDRDYSREASSVGNVSSAKSKNHSVPPLSSSDHHRHRGHSSDRHSPDHRFHNAEVSRPSTKRKSSDHKYEDLEEKQHRRDYQDDHHHRDHHYLRSESSAAKGSETDHRRRPEASTAKSSPEPPVGRPTTDKKQKASVFSRISFPGDDSTAAPKKRKLSSSSADAPVVSASSNHQQRGSAASNGYHEEHKARKSSALTAASASAVVDYESSDDDRHFKRRPSKYTSSSPPPPDKEEHRHSRSSREKERGRDRAGGYSKYK